SRNSRSRSVGVWLPKYALPGNEPRIGETKSMSPTAEEGGHLAATDVSLCANCASVQASSRAASAGFSSRLCGSVTVVERTCELTRGMSLLPGLTSLVTVE